MANPSTVLFLKEQGGDKEFETVKFNGNVTLQELMDGYGVSSVLECDQTGNPLTRTMVMSSPEVSLRSGHRYIVCRDAKNGGTKRSVTFSGKVVVREYQIDTGSCPSSAAASQSRENSECIQLGEEINDIPRYSSERREVPEMCPLSEIRVHLQGIPPVKCRDGGLTGEEVFQGMTKDIEAEFNLHSDAVKGNCDRTREVLRQLAANETVREPVLLTDEELAKYVKDTMAASKRVLSEC